MERNPWAKDGALDVPFAQLPKEEQDKDMVQYDVALTMSEAKFYDISNYLPQHVAQVVVEAKNRGENNVYKHNFSILFSEFDTAKTCFYKVHTRAFEGEKLWEKMRPIWREEGIERTKKLRAESVSRISEWQKRGESLKINWAKTTAHGAQRMAERGVSKSLAESIITTGKVFMQNGGEKFLYLTKSGAVVLTKAGEIVTAYTAAEFSDDLIELLKLIGVL